MRIQFLGRVPYVETVAAMQAFTESRREDTPDELWLCEHDPVYTQGVAGREDTVHDAGGIPVLRTNRGGQVTYHGPGQVLAYPLVDLRRQGCYVREYVFRLESAVLRLLEAYGVTGHRVPGAPGIYLRLADPFGHGRLSTAAPRAQPGVAQRQRAGEDPFRGLGKIAALGVKVSRHCTYHGLAVNVKMDLAPYARIDPCGYAGLQAIDLSTIGVEAGWHEVASRLGRLLAGAFEAPDPVPHALLPASPTARPDAVSPDPAGPIRP